MLYLSTWFYYIPFLMIAGSFFAEINDHFEPELVVDAGVMSDEYANWVASQLASQNSTYEEPSLQELVEMMGEIPLQGPGFIQDTETLVTTLSLEEFWNAYWADEAPYYVMSLNRDVEDYLLRSTVWGEPSPGYELPGGPLANGKWTEPVLKERKYNKVNRIYAAFTPDYGDEFITIQLLAKNDTYIKVM